MRLTSLFRLACLGSLWLVVGLSDTLQAELPLIRFDRLMPIGATAGSATQVEIAGADIEAVIRAIADAVSSVEGVKLLNVDPGKSTNRTVYTFAGPPELVCEAAVRAARVGSALIDMSKHRGEHPRFGAMDVCPLVPISGITMPETERAAP